LPKRTPPTKDDIKISQDILQTYSDSRPTEEPKKYETIIKENLAILRNNEITGTKNNDGTLRLLRGPEINSEFLNLFNKVKQRLIIFSPWIAEKVIDIDLINKFKELAKKGVCVFIGWGISRKEEEEEKPPSDELINTLTKIKDTNGLPTVFISWLGNKHEKEIIVDHSIHLMGSFNWLSYRGTYLPRGESVYLVTHKEMVREAAEYWQEAFTEAYLRKVQKTKDFINAQFIWDLCALLCVGNNKVDVIFDDLLDDLIIQKKVGVILDIFLLFFYKKQFDDSFMKCFEFLLNESNYIQSINSILHRVYKTERVVFNTIIQNYSKTLMSLKVINQKGKLIKKTETSLKFNFTE
jgi:hypothetical protein